MKGEDEDQRKQGCNNTGNEGDRKVWGPRMHGFFAKADALGTVVFFLVAIANIEVGEDIALNRCWRDFPPINDTWTNIPRKRVGLGRTQEEGFQLGSKSPHPRGSQASV